MSGELLLAIAYGASMIVTGAIAYRIVKRDYGTRPRRDEGREVRQPPAIRRTPPRSEDPSAD